MTALWRADQLADPLQLGPQSQALVWPTGHAALDQALPGGGWPRPALTECLVDAQGGVEWALWAPALAQAVKPALPQQAGGEGGRRGSRHGHSRGARVVLCIEAADAAASSRSARSTRSTRSATTAVAAPRLVPFARHWSQGGVDLGAHLVRVSPASAIDAAWVAEQALKSGACVAVLWWPGVDVHTLGASAWAQSMRRLHWAATEHLTPLVVFGTHLAAQSPSAAPLRLQVQRQGHSPNHLQVRILKRRGPPLPQPLVLEAPVLDAPCWRRWQAKADSAAVALKGLAPRRPQAPHPHALVRAASTSLAA